MAEEPTDGLAERLARVQGEIADAARAAGRDPEELTTIVVTKFHPTSLVRELHALGVRDVGENRHQDAEPKAAELDDLGLRWHFVGQLQSKKARAVRRYAFAVHSIDRESVVRGLASEEGPALPVFVQVDLTGDPGRGGVALDDVEPLVEHVAAAPGLELLGLMTVAPLGADPRRAFASVREAGERIRRIAPDARSLSMGMSGDFREAIAEGATHLRIGTAITGNRPQPG